MSISKIIEVEEKFTIDEVAINLVKKKLSKVSEVTFTDEYFDTPSFALLGRNQWLRKRDGNWQLKIPIYDKCKGHINRSVFQEIVQTEEIEKLLKDEWYKVIQFAAITTTRETYQLNRLELSIDITDFGYNLAEIEGLASGSSDVKAVRKLIDDLAAELNLSHEVKLGKVAEYLRVNYPEAYLMARSRGFVG